MNKIEVKKLFGRFNYNIELNDSGLTIITGPNGYGKSTILKIIENFSVGIIGMLKIYLLPFEEITLSFECGNYKVEKTDNGLKINEDYINLVELYDGLSEINHHITRGINTINKFEINENNIKFLEATLSDANIDNFFPTKITSIFKKFSEENQIISVISSKIGVLNFIKEQRLIKEIKSFKYRSAPDDIIVNVIDEIPTKLKNYIKDVSAEYSSKSAELDSTYLKRLFDNDVSIDSTEYEIKQQKMNEKYIKLKEYELVTIENNSIAFKKEYAKALFVYFEDFDSKYKMYEELISKLDLFTEIINSRLKFKKIKITRDNGIVIYDDLIEGRELNLSCLSSGEKQEIALFFQLIFEIENVGLLLIDEPEISLHIEWQKVFIDDLMSVIKKNKFNVIITTHSPQIISKHMEKNVDLGKLYNNGSFNNN